MKVFFIATPSQTLQIEGVFYAKLRFFSHLWAFDLQILRSLGRIGKPPEQENADGRA
jgi:hypothetical protein